MKLVLEINDKRIPFFMELIKSLDFIESVKKERTKVKIDKPVTHFSSEQVLANEWLTPEEDKAWKDL